MTDVAIIANGGANIASLCYALERLGASARLTADPAELAAARRVILPGVGAAADAMGRLQSLDLVDAVSRLTQPVLGICLGMQLLFASSEEGDDGADTECLGLLPERVARFPGRPGFPVPHMGWNQLRIVASNPLFDGIADGDYVYFVHSYCAPLGPWTLAATDYGGEFSAAVRHGNFHGVQFHPERSAAVGARVLANFLELG
jgi:imidazole glycerol-phosphate synthase subunit HisH